MREAASQRFSVKEPSRKSSYSSQRQLYGGGLFWFSWRLYYKWTCFGVEILRYLPGDFFKDIFEQQLSYGSSPGNMM